MATYLDGIDFTLERVYLRQALAGDDEAFVVLGSMYSEQVYAIARNLCSSDEEALELTRNAFQRARKKLSGIPARRSFRTLVCRFLVREAVERLRNKAPPVSASLERFLPAFENGRWVSAPRVRAEIEGLAHRRDIPERIREGFADLHPEDRAAFALIAVEELCYEEVAAIMEEPCSVVRQRAQRACLLLGGYLRHLAGERALQCSFGSGDKPK